MGLAIRLHPSALRSCSMRLQVARIRADLLHIFGCLHQFETFRLLCPVLHVTRKQLISDDLFYVSVLWQ